MRIGYLTYGLDRAPTGIGRYAVELLKALARDPGGHEIVVLATEREDTYGLRNMFEYHRVPGCRTLPALMSFGSVLLPVLARRYRLDAVHDPNGIAPFTRMGTEAALILTIHDAVAYVYPETHNAVDNWRYRWHLPYSARCADTVITVSECSRRDIQRFLGIDKRKIVVVAEGVDPCFTPVNSDSAHLRLYDRYGIRPPFVLYVGALNARKNIDRLLDAFSRVRSRHPDARLVVGGKKQWGTDEIDRAINRLALHDAVVFTGYVDEADLPGLYSAAELFVFPSLYEGFGLPPLESMACGTPVVTSNVSSLPEVAGDAAILVDPTDVSALAGAMERILSDVSLSHELRDLGVQRAAEYTWDRTARQTIAVYEQSWLLRGRTGDRTSGTDEKERQIAVRG